LTDEHPASRARTKRRCAPQSVIEGVDPFLFIPFCLRGCRRKGLTSIPCWRARTFDAEDSLGGVLRALQEQVWAHLFAGGKNRPCQPGTCLSKATSTPPAGLPISPSDLGRWLHITHTLKGKQGYLGVFRRDEHAQQVGALNTRCCTFCVGQIVRVSDGLIENRPQPI